MAAAVMLEYGRNQGETTMSDWRQELGGILGGKSKATRAEQENAVFEGFLTKIAVPALRQLAEELGRHGREAMVRDAPASAMLTVRNGAITEITFRVMKRYVPSGILPYAEVRLAKGQRFVNHDGVFREAGQPYTLEDITAEDIIRCFLKYYRTILNGDAV